MQRCFQEEQDRWGSWDESCSNIDYDEPTLTLQCSEPTLSVSAAVEVNSNIYFGLIVCFRPIQERESEEPSSSITPAMEVQLHIA